VPQPTAPLPIPAEARVVEKNLKQRGAAYFEIFTFKKNVTGHFTSVRIKTGMHVPFWWFSMEKYTWKVMAWNEKHVNKRLIGTT
jgi:hypothetical protein